jgi:hypothetical protein
MTAFEPPHLRLPYSRWPQSTFRRPTLYSAKQKFMLWIVRRHRERGRMSGAETRIGKGVKAIGCPPAERGAGDARIFFI